MPKSPNPERPISASTLWALYAALILGVGLFLALAELQDYLRDGGMHPWEPFLWEMSSLLAIGLLALGVYRWHLQLNLPAVGWPLKIAGHLLGILLFSLGHVVMILLLRGLAYRLAGMPYQHDTLLEVFGYEAAKDVVVYLVILAICHGVLLFRQQQLRQRELEQMRAELAEARLQRLAEQIQPHFLFNTLSLVSSVMYEDLERADRILSDLAELLRQTLSANQSPAHSVAEELRIVQPFLALMRERFGPRLEVEVSASPEALECAIPSLLLIAPVENAVKHGVERSSAPASVRVRAEIEAGELVLRVQDSAGNPTRDHRPGGIGLSNTRTRLATLFGEQASVQLRAREGGGAELTLRLPVSRISA